MYCKRRHTAVKINHNTREMTRVSLDKLQADEHCLRHSCVRRNSLEKGVDVGQKNRCKEILQCRVSSCLLGLRPDQEGRSDVVSGVAYVELQGEERQQAVVGYWYVGIV